MLKTLVMATPSLFLNDFTVLDFAFARADGIWGDSYFVSAELQGGLDAKDFLLDFSTAKKALKALVDNSLDHKLLVPASVEMNSQGLRWTSSCGIAWDYECPRTAFVTFSDPEINSAAIEHHLAHIALDPAMGHLPANVSAVKFSLSSPERFRGEASFRYTHGLRFHEGNCQRLFHGHRNPVEVWIDGQRSPQWEARLASEWNGAHFVSVTTLKNRDALDLPLGQRRSTHPGFAEVEYSASQGNFLGRFPASRVVLTESEPSIETMSALALKLLGEWGLRARVRVVAYEGLNKGSACEADLS